MKKETVLTIQQKLKDKSIGLIGDFCVDIYWEADMTRSELSRETPHFPLPVVKERVYPGAGGNVANNIAALTPKNLFAMSLYGDDWRGMLLKDTLGKLGINTDYFIACNNRFTNAYCKPIRTGISAVRYEDPRLDFESNTPVSEETEEKIIQNLEKLAKAVDILCVSDQFRFGIVTPKVRATLIRLAQNGLTVMVDSRYHIAEYTDCILKPNEVECYRAVYHNEGFLTANEQDFIKAANLLAVQNRATVFCTLGANGSYITDRENKQKERVYAQKARGELDICGAGDTTLSAFACALATGECYRTAAEFAGLASFVTIHKIGVTGTASFEEILSLCQ